MSFRWRLMGALALTALCAAVGTYLLTFRSVGDQFDAYRAQERRVAAHDAAVWLAEYWEAHGSWAGVQRYFSAQISFRWGGELVYQQSLMGQLMLLDQELQVVACADETLLGRCPETDERLGERIERAGVPVVVDDEKHVGTVVPLETVDLSPLEEDFLASVQRATLIGGSIALAVAAVLGTILATQLSAPLRQLIQATERIAQGDLSHRVPWRRRDETGRLAVAMNHMAEELQRSENTRQQLLTDVAHELRTPLTVIQGNLEALMDGVFPLTADSLSSVHEETLYLGALIEELRDLTLAEGG
ncbi:MAG: HAMP domain-containing protein, partial [Candidatus Bipolaricaulota bacterium]